MSFVAWFPAGYEQSGVGSYSSVAPGADPSLIDLRYSDVTGLRRLPQGRIELCTDAGKVLDCRLRCIQVIGEQPRVVAAAYRMTGSRSYGFTLLEPHDPQSGPGPGPIAAAGSKKVLLGPVEPASGQPGRYWLRAVMDNLTRGGAVNALEIAATVLR